MYTVSKDNLRSQGYICRKELNINYFHRDAQSLVHPLKRVGNSFEQILWEHSHGFGLNYNGQVYGVNANSLTKNTHWDKIAGTPLHKYIPCRVEKLLRLL
jgi:hypothetical protein